MCTNIWSYSDLKLIITNYFKWSVQIVNLINPSLPRALDWTLKTNFIWFKLSSISIDYILKTQRSHNFSSLYITIDLPRSWFKTNRRPIIFDFSNVSTYTTIKKYLCKYQPNHFIYYIMGLDITALNNLLFGALISTKINK